MSDNSDPQRWTVIIPREMSQRLEAVARKEHRKVSPQIMHFIAQGLDQWERTNGAIPPVPPEAR